MRGSTTRGMLVEARGVSWSLVESGSFHGSIRNVTFVAAKETSMELIAVIRENNIYETPTGTPRDPTGPQAGNSAETCRQQRDMLEHAGNRLTSKGNNRE